MSERDPRRRRKKRESVRKEEKFGEEISSPSPEKITDWRRDSRESDPDQDDLTVKIRHEPSSMAKIVFFVLFTLLAVTVGIVFVSLHGAERGPIDIFEEAHEPAEVIHGELDEHGKEIEHQGEEHIAHEEEHEADHEEGHEEDEDHEGGHEGDEDHDDHGHDDDDDDTIKGFLSGFMGIFRASTPEPTSEEEEKSVEETSTASPIEEPEERHVPADTKISEPDDLIIQSQVEDERQQDAEDSDDETEELQPTETEESVSAVKAEQSVNVDEEEEDILGDGGEDDDKETPQDDGDADPMESWVTEHIPLTSAAPPVEDDDDSNIYYDPETGHSEDINDLLDEIDGSDTIQDSLLDEEDSEPTESYYENDDITNEYDYLIKEDLDDAEKILEKSPEEALKVFEDILLRHPNTSRGRYGRARALDMLAEAQRNNKLLEQAIMAYEYVLLAPSVPDKLFRLVGDRAVNRMRFRGLFGRAIQLQKRLAERYLDDVQIRNQLAVSYLLIGKGQEAKKVLKEVLEKDAGNGYAMVHYGFILKTEDNKYEEAIKYLSEGIATQHEGVIDGRFFFHLGDAFARIGKPDEAMKVYENGAKLGLFLSAYQRSLYNVNGLTARPWWKPEETPYHHHILRLERYWEKIRDEGNALLNSKQTGFMPEAEGLRDTGDWKQFELFARGRMIKHNCQKAPFTCSLVEKIPDAASCKRGQVKFSVMQPGTHVWAHTGPTNCRLRAHLGLVVPSNVKIRVANETRGWVEGKTFIFDDSFEHEVWHNGDSYRLVLIIDFWHPELTAQQKASLTPI